MLNPTAKYYGFCTMDRGTSFFIFIVFFSPIHRLIAEETTWRVVCVKDIRYHITAENIVDVTRLYIINKYIFTDSHCPVELKGRMCANGIYQPLINRYRPISSSNSQSVVCVIGPTHTTLWPLDDDKSSTNNN